MEGMLRPYDRHHCSRNSGRVRNLLTRKHHASIAAVPSGSQIATTIIACDFSGLHVHSLQASNDMFRAVSLDCYRPSNKGNSNHPQPYDALHRGIVSIGAEAAANYQCQIHFVVQGHAMRLS